MGCASLTGIKGTAGSGSGSAWRPGRHIDMGQPYQNSPSMSSMEIRYVNIEIEYSEYSRWV